MCYTEALSKLPFPLQLRADPRVRRHDKSVLEVVLNNPTDGCEQRHAHQLNCCGLGLEEIVRLAAIVIPAKRLATPVDGERPSRHVVVGNLGIEIKRNFLE
jgi:hypothetical protein